MSREKYPKIVRRYGDRRDKGRLPAGRVVYPVLAVALMATIFWFSAQPADSSQAMSDGLLYRLLDLLGGILPQPMLLFLETYIRKVAHFIVYLLLGILVGCSLFAWLVPESEYDMRVAPDPKNPPINGQAGRAWLWSLILCIAYAASDEWHQTYVPGRSGELRDVILDTCGAVLGLLLLLVTLALKKNRLRREAMKKLG